MTRALIKNMFREIGNTKARFFSIMAIIALGVGFFTGIKTTSPSMYHLAETYYDEQNLMDFRLVSTTGFSDDDIDAIAKTDGVSSVMPSYFYDVTLSAEDGGKIVRVIALPKQYKSNPELNTLTLSEGSMPEHNGEIAVEGVGFARSSHKVGQTLTLAPKAGDNKVTDTLKTLEYKITGKLQSPLYISYQRGGTTVGDGKIDEYMYVPADTFKTERYTELYVRADFSSKYSPFSDEYEDAADALMTKLKQRAKEREKAFQVEVIDKAKAELSKSQKDYKSQKAEADKKLGDADKKLKESEKTYLEGIASAEEKLSDAKSKIDSGSAQLNSSKQTYSTEMSSAWSQLSQKEAALKSAREEYSASKSAAEAEIAAAQKEIDDGYTQYEAALKTFTETTEPQLLAGIEQAQGSVSALTAAIEAAGDEETKAALQTQLQEAQAALDSLNSQYSAAKTKLETTKSTLDESQKTLDAKQKESKKKLSEALKSIESGEAALASAKSTLSAKQSESAAQISSAEEKLIAASSAYASGQEELEANRQSGKTELEKGKKEYTKNKTESDKKFADAAKKIADAEKKVKELKPSTWYVFTREDNPGYSTFTQNADRLDAVASVFPLFFLLVAILVCVTTMTRLIEEKRTEIATLKALGYGNSSIILKYVIYALIAAVSGSVLGMLAGSATLPFIIYNAYKIMYYIGDISLVLNIPVMILGTLAAVLCTTAVSVIVCGRSLGVKPAQAMRPKAPKAGKRILLERITPLWSHMGFTAKLTARNLFRYKARLCMTVIGVAGCTALIVAAFGLLNSFDPLTDTQFGEIYRYDVVVVPKNSGTEQELSYLAQAAGKSSNVNQAMFCLDEKARLVKDGKESDAAISINVFSDTDHIDDMVHLRERQSQKPLTLKDSGVMINEKLAVTSKIKQGDTIVLRTDNDEVEARVDGIYEQYVNNYIYMTPALYQKLFNKQPEYNMLCADLKEIRGKKADEFSSGILRDDRIVAVTFMDEKISEFKNMLDSLDMVVLVMIVCAAALAFVVLYNLTNINIAERLREIATFKVLGFYNRETTSFIFKENLILTVLGIAAGLGLGVLLTGFIVRTVEIDNVMFGRDIYLTSYLYAAAFTLLFSLTVNAVMSFKIKAINMVESLKSVE